MRHLRFALCFALVAGCASKPAPVPEKPEPVCSPGTYAKNGACVAIDPPCPDGSALTPGKGCVGPAASASVAPPPVPGRRTVLPGLEVEDLREGTGRTVAPGDRATFHYIGRLASGGMVFDDSRAHGPIQVRIGVGQLIKGWDVGIPGMRVGGLRRLVIAPELGYGDRSTGKIPPGSTLEFEVELIEIGSP